VITAESQRTFAAKLEAARVAQHLSIRTVGRIAKAPPTTVHGWLTGTHFPALTMRGNYLRMVETLGLMAEMPADIREELWIVDESRAKAAG